MKVTEFHKSRLSSEEKKLYEFLYSQVKSGNFTISFDGYSLESIQLCYEALYLDHTELYYLPYDALIEQDEETCNGKITLKSKITLKKIYSDKLCEEIIKRFNLAVKRIKSIIPEGAGELETEIAIIKYIHRICYSDIDNEYNQNAASVLAFGKAQCSGYAKAMSLLLNRFGIEAFVVAGEVLSSDFTYVPHAWNIVKIDNKYYQLDILYGHEMRLIKYKMDLEFFNINDDKMKRTHKWDSSYPVCSDERFLSFREPVKLDNKPVRLIKRG